jgi:hypothetical protein
MIQYTQVFIIVEYRHGVWMLLSQNPIKALLVSQNSLSTIRIARLSLSHAVFREEGEIDLRIARRMYGR